MPLLSLDDFNRGALDTLMTFATIPSLSPDFDAEWRENGYLEEAARLLAEWARSRKLHHVDVAIRSVEDRTPMVVVTVDSTAGEGGTVVLYGHLDKQPPLGDWSEGLDPYVPVTFVTSPLRSRRLGRRLRHLLGAECPRGHGS